jgi:hypothetical protein
MSFKLVKKMIQQTEELEELTNQGHLSKKRKRAKEEVVVPLTKNELLQRHIQSKIRLDQTLSARSSASKQTVDRLEAQRKKQSKLRSKAIVGNSRGSAYQKSHEHHEPTFNKKRHREEKKERMLRDIAKLLNKTKKSTK